MSGSQPAAIERRALQIAVAILALIPISAGLAGALIGVDALGHGAPPARDVASHERYLSGLLFGIGLAYCSTIPRIETHGARFRLLTFIVFVGGLARLIALGLHGAPSAAMLFGLAMELAVTPTLALWRERIERLCMPPAARAGAAFSARPRWPE